MFDIQALLLNMLLNCMFAYFLHLISHDFNGT